MQQRFAAARQENTPFLEEASTLLNQRDDAETKNQLLEAFNNHFLMSENELRTLTTNADIVDNSFFEVLARVKRIHRDCQILLGTENQRLGLELMEQSSRNLNNAYQKLYRWIQREFRMLNFENPQVSSMVRRALKALAERPTLFQSCLDFFAEAREHVLQDAFYSALTGPTDARDRDMATKPIEYHSHDPLRYVGDMLAWIHAASVSERETLESLAAADRDEIVLGNKKGVKSEPWTGIEDEAFDGHKALEELAGRNLAGVAKVLRQRVEQIIQNQEDPVLIYKLVNLLCFYRVTFTKLLGLGNILLESFVALERFAFRQFQTVMEENARFVHADLDQLPLDSHLPDFLSEALDHFKVLVKTFDTSLTPISSREKEFEVVISVALHPFLDVCKKMVLESEEPLHSTCLINCFQAAQATLSGYDFVQQKISGLEEDITQHMTHLIDFQHSYLLHSSGLYPMIAALAPLSELSSNTVLSMQTIPVLQPAALQHASQILDEFLPSALMDAKENLKNLANKQLASNITAKAAQRFCEDFEFIEGRLAALDQSEQTAKSVQGGTAPSQATLLRQFFPRTSGEIRVLLS